MNTETDSYFCQICLKKDHNDKHDIRKLKFVGRSAVEVVKKLFAIEIMTSFLENDDVPRRICKKCQDGICIAWKVAERAFKSHETIGDVEQGEVITIREKSKSKIHISTIIEHCFCRVCLKKDQDEKNDIRQLKFLEKSALETFKDLFKIKINTASLEYDNVPRNVCQECQNEMQIMLKVKQRALVSHDITFGFESGQVIPTEKELDVNEDMIDDVKVKNEPVIEDDCDLSDLSQSPNPSEIEESDGKSNEDTFFNDDFSIEEEKLTIDKPTDHTQQIKNNEASLGPSKPYKCGHCLKLFFTKKHVQDHMACHRETTPFQCDICLNFFARKNSLKKHFRIHLRPHDEEKCYKCNKCDKSYSVLSKLKTHLTSHNGKEPFKCDQCKKSFVQHKSLEEHMWCHSSEKRFKCHLCNKLFRDFYCLKIHLMNHAGEKPFKCEQCPKTFVLRKFLNKHLKCHSDEKPFKCKQCDKAYKRLEQLKRHLISHSGKKIFKCDECQKLFAQKDQLKNHMKSHSNEKPFKCDQCQKSFKENGSLKKHLDTHFEGKKFKCNQCEKMYRQADALREHLKTHTGRKPFKCGQCKKSYETNSKLNNHLKTHIAQKPYKCDQCHMSFLSPSLLKLHLRYHSRLNVVNVTRRLRLK